MEFYMGSLNKKASGAQCFIMALGLFWDIATGLPWTPNGAGSLEPKEYCIFLPGAHYLTINSPNGADSSLNKLLLLLYGILNMWYLVNIDLFSKFFHGFWKLVQYSIACWLQRSVSVCFSTDIKNFRLSIDYRNFNEIRVLRLVGTTSYCSIINIFYGPLWNRS